MRDPGEILLSHAAEERAQGSAKVSGISVRGSILDKVPTVHNILAQSYSMHTTV